jgi:hypothetical protein
MQEKSLISGEKLLEDTLGEQERRSSDQSHVWRSRDIIKNRIQQDYTEQGQKYWNIIGCSRSSSRRSHDWKDGVGRC